MSPCEALEDAVAEGRPLDAQQRAHASTCERCRALTDTDETLARLVNARGLERSERPHQLPPALRAAVEGGSTAVAPFSVAKRGAAPLLLSSALAMGALRFIPRADLAHRAGATFAGGAILLLSLVIAGVLGVLNRGPSGIGASLLRRVVYLALAFVLAELTVASVADPVEASVVLARDAVLRGIIQCASHGALVAAFAGVGLFVAARRTVITAPSLAGAVAGASAGLTGTLVLHLACPVSSLTHGMIAHVAPMVLGALAGAITGRRVLAV